MPESMTARFCQVTAARKAGPAAISWSTVAERTAAAPNRSSKSAH